MQFEDARALPAASVVKTDICIAGGGAAGITLARALAGHTRSVVVLESGGEVPDAEVQALYDGTAEGDHYDLRTSRLRMLGGSTNHWGGWLRPLDAHDFAAHRWMRFSGWPITPADLDPYYPGAGEACGITETVFDAADLVASGVIEPLVESDVVTTSVYRLNGGISLAQLHRSDLERAANVRVLLNANVVDIVTSANRRRVDALQAVTLTGRRLRVEAEMFVLALGGIENARVLLAAGIGNEHDQVGRYFMDHLEPTVGTVVLTRQPASNFDGIRFDLVRTGVTFTADALRDEQLPNMCFLLEPWALHARADLTTQVDHHDIASILRGLEGEAIDPLSLQVRCEQEPDPRNRVTLGNERDALGMPRAELHWKVGLHDRMRYRRAVEIFARELGAEGAGWLRFERPAFDPAEHRYFYASHHMGTTRMHDDERQGVVDVDCRVHGLDNFYIAGSSVFPTGGYANPTLTIAALALRLAERLRSLT